MVDILTKVRFRQGTLAAWTAPNPVLALGEPGYETDTKIIRVGDGVTAFLSLPKYANEATLAAQVAAAAASAAAAAASAGSVVPGFLQRSGLPCTVGGTSNAITLNTGGAVNVIPTDMTVEFVATTAPTGAVTVALDVAGVKSGLTLAGGAIPANHWAAGQLVKARYDGAAWRLEPDGLYGRVAAIIEDRKAAGTDGGAMTNPNPTIRVLNTLVANDGGLVTLAGNQFTLPAGKRRIWWSAPAYGTDAIKHQSFLYNVTDAAVVAVGSNVSNAVNTTIRSEGSALVTTTAQKVFEIRHQFATVIISGNNLGDAAGVLAGGEVYTRVEITPLKP